MITLIATTDSDGTVALPRSCIGVKQSSAMVYPRTNVRNGDQSIKAWIRSAGASKLQSKGYHRSRLCLSASAHLLSYLGMQSAVV